MGLQADKLIRSKEQQGVLIAIGVKIFVLLVFLGMQVVFSHNREELYLAISVIGPALFILLIALIYLIRGKGIYIFGLVSLLIDIGIFTALPFIWYNSVGGEAAIPRTYLLKTALPYIILVFLIVSTLSLQPIYPFIISIAATGYLVFLYKYTSLDPRFRLDENMVEAMLGSAVNTWLYTSIVVIIFTTGLLLSYLAWQARKTITESAVKEVQNNQLARYFSPNAAQEILTEEESFFQPGGRTQDVVVFFCDIREFTKISETYSTKEVFDLLTEYHSVMASILFKYDGTLDKFTGDGILATFGTPYPSTRDAENALKAAIEMRKALQAFNANRKTRGLFTIEHGIGIHYGPAMVGNIGMKDRLEYTVIGDTVNIASRVEGACKILKEDILITESMADKLPVGYALKKLQKVRFKNKTESIQLYGITEEEAPDFL